MSDEQTSGGNGESQATMTIGVDASQLEYAKSITQGIAQDLMDAEQAMVRMGLSTIRPQVAQFAVQMEGRMRDGDQRGWVWDDQARQTASPANIEYRILTNLSAGLAALDAGDTAKATECFTDISNLSMLLNDLAQHPAVSRPNDTGFPPRPKFRDRVG